MAREPGSKLRVAAVGDLHCREDQHGRFRLFVRQVNAAADVLLLCGDLTDRGLAEEVRTLVEELSELRIPCAAVLGNHDLENGQEKLLCAELARVGVHCLSGDHYVFEKVLGVAGIKGFGGGYGNATLQAFGETQTKAFVQESVSESLKLEAALGQLETTKKVVIMHYAPVRATTEGENPEVRPFLGTSRLASPVDRSGADAIFHGHSHHGTLRGATDKGVPVYNVAMPLLKRHDPERRFVVVEI
ncbi:MAG: metallophosphoesterase [Deltaproteobacteria bacterium]|nr:metallophosphoesterase [Deltaproteobacteria bacterium]